MLVKKYIVNNMNEAMTRIRYELGNDAVIISQRKVRKAGIAGFFTNKLIEVTATKDNSYNNIKKDENNESLDAIKELMEKEISSRTENIKEKEEILQNNKEKKEIYKEFKELKSLVEKLVDKEVKNENSLKEKFKEQDVINEAIEEIFEGVGEEDTKVIEKRIRQKIKVEKAILKGKTVLVGPTGVGKTTTIAKLAGKLSLNENKSVGLITIDTYRIGAVEQLKTYAEIMNIPFKVVMTLKEMELAIESMKDCDVILIDTTGRSSRNIMQISELKTFIEKLEPDNISLVISATTKNKDLISIINGYKGLAYKDIIITKLDETISLGTLLNIAHISKLPIRFVTTGQNVPNDIKQCSPEEVMNEILGRECLC